MTHTIRRTVMVLLSLAILIGGARLSGVALAQNCVGEVEPNNDPDQAAQVAGPLFAG